MVHLDQNGLCIQYTSLNVLCFLIIRSPLRLMLTS